MGGEAMAAVACGWHALPQLPTAQHCLPCKQHAIMVQPSNHPSCAPTCTLAQALEPNEEPLAAFRLLSRCSTTHCTKETFTCMRVKQHE